jgi:hypothetical protein
MSRNARPFSLQELGFRQGRPYESLRRACLGRVANGIGSVAIVQGRSIPRAQGSPYGVVTALSPRSSH